MQDRMARAVEVDLEYCPAALDGAIFKIRTSCICCSVNYVSFRQKQSSCGKTPVEIIKIKECRIVTPIRVNPENYANTVHTTFGRQSQQCTVGCLDQRTLRNFA